MAGLVYDEISCKEDKIDVNKDNMGEDITIDKSWLINVQNSSLN